MASIVFVKRLKLLNLIIDNDTISNLITICWTRLGARNQNNTLLQASIEPETPFGAKVFRQVNHLFKTILNTK